VTHSIAYLCKFRGHPHPDALQDVLTRERGATSPIPEQPEDATATSVWGGLGA
jgi:hypothetical protein